MNISSTPLKDLQVINLDVFKDERGFFVEKFNQQKFAELGVKINFVQDNFSISKPGVIRGLHYQTNPSQSKLVGCMSGKIWDVAVDIRKNSPTFGRYFGIELTAESGTLLMIPAGFAHGFCVLGNEPAGVFYKVDNFFSKEGDGGIAFNDPEIAIEWPIKNPIISQKDLLLPSFSQYQKSAKF